MFALRWTRLTEEFDAAFHELASARAAYEDRPRDAESIRVLGAARIRLDDARAAMRVERERLGLDEPWRVQPAATSKVDAPPLWSVDH